MRTNVERLGYGERELGDDDLKEISGGKYILSIGQSESYTCSVCGYRAKNANDYNIHFRTKHQGGGSSVGFA